MLGTGHQKSSISACTLYHTLYYMQVMRSRRSATTPGGRLHEACGSAHRRPHTLSCTAADLGLACVSSSAVTWMIDVEVAAVN